MIKNLFALILALNTYAAFGAAKIQDSDVKSLSQVTAAGGTVSSLINDSKIYDPLYNMQLSSAISAGLIGGSGTAGNLLTNGSFEAGVSGWTYGSGSSASLDTTNYIDGHQSVALTLSSVSSGVAIVAQAVTPGVQIVGQYLDESIWVKTTVSALNVCGTLAGAQYSCVAVMNDNAWHQYQFHPSYTSGTIGVQVVSTAAIASGTVNVDAGSAGISSGLVNVSAISDWQNCGTNTISATTTAPVKGTVTVDRTLCRQVGSDMEVRIEYSQSAVGSATAGSGDYLFLVPNSKSIDLTKASAFTGVATIHTNNNSVGSALVEIPTGAGTGSVVVYDATHVRLIVTSTGASTFQSTGSAYFNLNAGAESYTATYRIPIQGWTSNVGAARSDQTNFGWTNGGPNLITATTTAPTKGTTSRDVVWYKRNGQNLDVRIEYVQTAAGSSGSGDYLFALPNGLVADTTLIQPYTTIGTGYPMSNNLGFFACTNSTPAAGTGNVALYDSTHVRLFCNATNSTANYNPVGSTWQGTSAAGLSYTATYSIPISGWTETQKAPVLIGGITNASPTSERLIRALVSPNCTTSPCTIVNQSGDFSSITRASTGQYQANFAVAFSAPPTCVTSSSGTGGAQSSNGVIASTTGVQITYFNSTNGNVQDSPFNLICMGPR